MKNISFILGAALVAASPVWAQSSAPTQGALIPAPPVQPAQDEIRSLELSAGTQSLSNNLGNWGDVTLKGAYGAGKHLFQGELSGHRRFNKDGVYVGVSDTYTFNEDWYGSLAVGAGDGAFYLPKYRMDATVYRKFLPNRNLVGSVGVGYYKAPDVYSDRSLSLGVAYYFDQPWILEGGVRFNRSNPGSVDTQQQFVAVTYGRAKQNLVTARYGWGEEGYLAIAANTQLVNFKSREASIAWRHWLNSQTGVMVGANRYSNPSYRRTGFTVGIFHDF
ncbi:MAG TPA: YaiO family outer membrane beta-barrel protein [Polaromonas sp.]|nr:YaiO family outer membrane beta-barrel protein [Polaromonas sp.]